MSYYQSIPQPESPVVIYVTPSTLLSELQPQLHASQFPSNEATNTLKNPKMRTPHPTKASWPKWQRYVQFGPDGDQNPEAQLHRISRVMAGILSEPWQCFENEPTIDYVKSKGKEQKSEPKRATGFTDEERMELDQMQMCWDEYRIRLGEEE